MNILVIGDSCIDEYIYCTTNRFCPDAPVPILKPEAYVSTEGMAGNVADNLKSLGANVELITNAPIPAGSSLELLSGNKVVMEDNDALSVTATGSTDVALSIMEIS